MRDAQRLVWSGLRGRNGADSPIRLAEDEAVEVLNMDFTDGALGKKRHGAIAESLANGPDVQLHGLARHVPTGTDETVAELWGFGHMTGFPTTWAFRRAPNPDYLWTLPSQVGAVTSVRLDVSTATLNGKLFMAFKSLNNRLRVWDGTTIRYVGLLPPAAAPVVANTGTGSYPTTLRYYKTAWAAYLGVTGVRLRQSDLSPAAAFTPSGTGAAARVSRPSPTVGDEKTHWLLYASGDDVYSNYHLVAVVAFATMTWDDSALPPYAGETPPQVGMHIPPPNAKFLLTDGNRLLMAGAHETTSQPGETPVKNNRVWYTRVLGSSDLGDDESIPNTPAVGVTPAQKNWIDIGENDGGIITGMGLIEGVIFVFKRRQTWRLVPTGDDLGPYQAFMVSNEIGAMNHQSIVSGEDGTGTPSLYFYTYRGLYQLSLSGALTYLGHPIEDVWQANPAGQPGTFGVYYAERRQVWHHIAGRTAAENRLAVYDIDRGGWSLFTTGGLTFHCAVMYSETVSGASAGKVASNNLKPYFGADGNLWTYDIPSAAHDAGVLFQAYVKSRPYFPAGIGTRVLAHDAVVLAEATPGVTLTLTLDRDFGRETRTATVNLTPEANETRILRRAADSGFDALAVVQFQIGDGEPVENHWVLDALSVPIETQESLS